MKVEEAKGVCKDRSKFKEVISESQIGNGFNVIYVFVFKGLVWCPGQNKRIAPLSFLHGCRKRRLKN
jgi:hypothetical protein